MDSGASSAQAQRTDLPPFAEGPRRVPSELYWNHLTASWESAVDPGAVVPNFWLPAAPRHP